VHWSPGFPDFPLLWWRHWIRIYLSSHGAPLCGLRQEVKAGILYLSSTSGNVNEIVYFEKGGSTAVLVYSSSVAEPEPVERQLFARVDIFGPAPAQSMQIHI
jgi:hypothetical protein